VPPALLDRLRSIAPRRARHSARGGHRLGRGAGDRHRQLLRDGPRALGGAGDPPRAL